MPAVAWELVMDYLPSVTAHMFGIKSALLHRPSLARGSNTSSRHDFFGQPLRYTT